jgi:putative ABC transport system permease protein
MSQTGSFLLLWRRTALRHARLAPGQTVLLIGILALGVAVYVAVRLANRAAVTSFAHFTDTLTGQSDWIVRAPAGPLSETVLPDLRRLLGSRPVHLVPVLEVSAAPPATTADGDRFGRTSYTLLGVDLVSLGNLAVQRRSTEPFFRETPERGAAGENSFWSSLDGPPTLWLSPALPSPRPTELTLLIDDRVETIPVAGVIPIPPEAPKPPARLLVMDLPQLQRLSGREAQLDRVELIVEPGPRLAERQAEIGQLLEDAAEGRWLVTTPGARRESAATMTQAFRLNLTVLSLIALLVGLYLVFQALDGAVVRRRAEIAILRSLGVEERMIQRLWLAESAVLGLIGGAVGVALGWLGAQGAVRAVGETVNALYFASTVQAARLEPVELAGGLALGLVASVIAGWIPARQAARTPPAHVMQRSAAPAAGARVLAHPGVAVALIMVGIALAWAPPWQLAGGGRFPGGGYAAALCWILGGGILSGTVLPWLRHGLRAARQRAPLTVAAGHLRQPSGRHRIAAAALHCAVGMTAGMIILVASFDETVRGWVARSLQADLYLASDAVQSASDRGRIAPATVHALREHPAVVAVSERVMYPVVVDGWETQVQGASLALIPERVDLAWVQEPADRTVFDPARNAGLALVSESFSERFRRRVGDSIALPTPHGARELRIVGIFADYGNEQGSIMVDRTHLRQWFDDDHVTNVSLWLTPTAEAETVRADLAAAYPALSIYTNARLREEILRIFRQTFAITYALELIGVFVAVVGLALTLTSVLLDRRDELTTLRALGFSRRELAVATSIEGCGVAFAAVIGGLALSFALGWLLIAVINKQSFGWTLGFAVPWQTLVGLAVVVTGSGAAVGWWVGARAADLPADRDED